ncbi:MAG: TonB-dependent receptor, partial [Sediminibacterium sp.]
MSKFYLRSLKGVLILLMCYGQYVFAQNPLSKQITGTVKDTKGEMLPGVSIQVKGVTGGGGATTGADGKYKIAVSGNTAVLVFTHVGYQTKEQLVGDKSVVNITLSDRPGNLDEVVVIGYGQLARKDLTGSVSKVDIADLNKAPVKSFDDALAGRIAGVQVTSPDGQPGASPSIVIRGGNSVTQDNSPLYVIDGFPIENYDNNTINPADIESIDVLKDASATAIYGARGSNGVIIITTKKGKTGPSQVSYNSYYGIQSLTSRVKLLRPYEYVKYTLELDSVAVRAQPNSYNFYNIYSPTFNPTGTGSVNDYLNQEGIDWQSQVLRKAPMKNHEIAIRGGNNDTKYAISGSYMGQEGVLIASDFKRYQARIVLDQNINNKWKVGINTNYSYITTSGLQVGGTETTADPFLISLWRYRPALGPNDNIDKELEDAQDENATGVSNYQWNPMLTLTQQSNNRFSTLLTANGYIEYKILPELKLRITGGINTNNLRQEKFNTSLSRLGSLASTLGQNGPNGTRMRTELTNLLNENTLTFNKTFAQKHSLNVVVGYTMGTNKIFSDMFGATGVPNESLGIDGLAQGTPVLNRTSRSSNKMASFLGRVNYGYKGRYLATASFRYDGSSKFLGDNVWGAFPSGSVAWRFIEEDFLKNNKILSEGKLRVSHGIIGNNRVTDNASYALLGQGSAGAVAGAYTPGGVVISGAYPRNLANGDLKWETTAETDLGLDLGFFKQRINLTVEFYNKKTSDLLLLASLPGVTGYPSAFQNIGAIQNRGLEFELTTLNLDTKEFKWSSSFNISFNRNKVLALTSGQSSLLTTKVWLAGYPVAQTPGFIAEIGQPVGMFYGLQSDGVYQLTDFNENTPGTYTLKSGVPFIGTVATTRPGNWKYKDLNGDGSIDGRDQTTIGNPNPKFIGGFSNNFSYKNFDLNVFLQFSYGNDIMNVNRLVMDNGATATNQFATAADRWTPTNPSNTVARAGAGAGPSFYPSRIIEDGSYLRLKTINIGYRFSPELLKKLKIASIRCYVSAQNIFTWTKYSGIDPESNSFPSALTQGMDYSAYPR